MLPNELTDLINSEVACRESQVRALVTLYASPLPTPPLLCLHGLPSTGKSLVLSRVLENADRPSAIIKCSECVTGRHLLEETARAARAAAREHVDGKAELALLEGKEWARCETVAALEGLLRRAVEAVEGPGKGRGLNDGGPVQEPSDGKRKRALVLVFDGVDRLREVSSMLVPALARVGQRIPNLSLIFTLRIANPALFHTHVPHLAFPAYTRAESLRILAAAPLPLFPADELAAIAEETGYTALQAAEDGAWLWERFTGLVWDTLAKGAARDVVSFRAACGRLWSPFTEGVRSGEFGTRDFARLVVARRTLVQGEDGLGVGVGRVLGRKLGEAKRGEGSENLPYYSKYILCAAYLASYNPPRTDLTFFSKATDKKRKKKAPVSTKAQKHRKIPRTLLGPSPFPLDRMLAILHAIVPDPLPQTADILTQVATLTTLRLLLRSGAAGGDVLDSGCKWRTNYGWEYVSALGRSVGFELRDYLADG